MKQINPVQSKSEFEQNGYVIVRDVLDMDLIKEAQAHVDWLLARNPGRRPELLDYDLVTQDSFWVRLVSDERLLDVAEQFIGPDLGLFASHYIAKQPFDGKAVPWHQDGSYWPLEPMEVVSFWLALDRSDEENGCMKVIPNTQHLTLLPRDRMIEQTDESLFPDGMDPDDIDESAAVNVVLNPGDISIHHPNLIHGSRANTSPRWRRGLTIRYIPTSTRILEARPHCSAFIFRGQGHANGNAWNPWPICAPETSMPFAGQAAWNERCVATNARYHEFLAATA